MMISPEIFYEDNLKGKSTAQIMTVIRNLKCEIGRLKNIVEHPDYGSREFAMCPSESTQIHCSREYLERAKQALVEAGGEYIPSATEKKAMEFDNNIPYINKIEFRIGGFTYYFDTITYIIDGDKICESRERSITLKPFSSSKGKLLDIDKEDFLDRLDSINIGEWSRNYDSRKFGCFVMDGTKWQLNIYYSNGHRPIKIYGDNAYPYNFAHLLDLFGIED